MVRIALGIRWFVMPLFEKGIAGGRVGFAWKPSSGLLVCYLEVMGDLDVER